MKTLNEMTELQILALTNDQIEKIVKLRKAQEGFRLLAKPKQPEYEEVPEKDLTYYFVKNLNGYCFTRAEDAQAVLSSITEALPAETYYSRWNSESPIQITRLSGYDKGEAELKVESQKSYSPEIIETAAQAEKRNSEVKKTYDSAKAEYDKHIEDVQWLVDEVWNRVFEVRRKYEKLAKLQTDYAEYIVLANNDEKVATAFLKKANTISDEEEKIIKGKKIVLKTT